jgi:hypothetical protein
VSDHDPITAAIESAIAAAEPEPVIADSDPIEGDEAPAPEAEADPAPEAEAKAEEPTEEAKPSAEQQPKKRGVIPLHRHEAVLTNARRAAEVEKAELNKRIEELSRYESQEFKTQLQFLQILENEPARAVEILRHVDPDRFGKLSWAEQQVVAAAVADAAVFAPAPAGEMPAPDALLPDGTLGYSAEGAQKLLDWRMTQERTKLDKELAELRKDLDPIKKDREARAAFEQSVTKMSSKLTDARTNWEGFTDNEGAIKAFLEQNKTAGLEEAYRAVVVPKLRGDREAIRAEERKKLIDEMNAKSKAKTLAPGQLPSASAQPASSDPDARMTEIIRASMAQIK